MIPAGLRSQVEAWIREDPDPGDQGELRALLAACEQGGGRAREAVDELTDRFAAACSSARRGCAARWGRGRTG